MDELSDDGLSPSNLLRGKLPPELVKEICDSRVPPFVPSIDQLDVFDTVKTTRKHIFAIDSLAGTGKTAVLSVLIEALLKQYSHVPKRVILILQPSKNLRDEAVRETMAFLPKEDIAGNVFWLGREAENPSVELWEAKLEELVKGKMAPELEQLRVIGQRLVEAYRVLQEMKYSWSEVCAAAATKDADAAADGHKTQAPAESTTQVPWTEIKSFLTRCTTTKSTCSS